MKGRQEKRNRANSDDDDVNNPIVDAINAIEMPDCSYEIREVKDAINKLTEVVEELASTISRGLDALADAKAAAPPATASASLDVAAIGKAICTFLDEQRGFCGCETFSFPVVANLIDDDGAIFDEYS